MDVESIFDNHATTLSYFQVEAVSYIAPSELEFTFDDDVVNSQAYRRVFIKARSEIQQLRLQEVDSDAVNMEEVYQDSVDSQKDDGLLARDLRESENSCTTDPARSPLRGEGVVSQSKRVISLPFEFASTCSGCSKTIIGPQVTALGQKWHAKCFTCSVSTTIIAIGLPQLTPTI